MFKKLRLIKRRDERSVLQVMTLWFCAEDVRARRPVRWLAKLTVLYVWSPIDLIPDFIPVLGLLDELLLLPLGIWLTIKMVPDPVVAECRQQAQAWLDARKPKPQNYVAAAVFVALWILTAWLAWRWLAT